MLIWRDLKEQKVNGGERGIRTLDTTLYRITV